MDSANPVGLRGIEFIEFSGPTIAALDRLFLEFGFSRTQRHRTHDITHYQQNDIHFLLNGEQRGFSADFARIHGPSICSMGWRVDDAYAAQAEAVRRGARVVEAGTSDLPYPAIYGIGDSLIYFIDHYGDSSQSLWTTDFVAHDRPHLQAHKGFLRIDHLTNNVPAGQMEAWGAFYTQIFGFTTVRYFDIRGARTGLTSYALRSPDGSFCIPINQPKSDADQIAEYLRDYHGPGVQHLAFLTDDIVASLDALQGSAIETLEIEASYYDDVFTRVPGVREDKARIKEHQVLVDGDADGYLLQIFTKNIIGPIFIEIIQRANNQSFGEGNFGALFRTIEKDQERRGVL